MEQMPSNMPVIESKPGPAGWLPVWIKAVTKPSEQTYVEITESPEATQKTAFIWIFIAGTVSGIFQALITGVNGYLGRVPQFPIPGMEQFMPTAPAGSDAGATAISLVISLCLSPLVGAVSVLFFAIGTAITQWIAKQFRGVGTFEKLAYASAAISVPFTLVSSVLSIFGLIPLVGFCTGFISIALSFYVLYLQITAVKAINRFGWGQAAGSVLAIPGILLICSCVLLIPLLFMGPAIGDVFSSINQSLAP